ncbi:GNAT family N-acetyltransferase [Pedobacter sp. HMF7647]|uniref:GNAT family N-acetyltransferase n=1 Tax=Hufsiella arboris TaxID=2695275 RepID=A0A7K1YD49_9SPHI|nr:GNAT family N-acetyltransferase [Hufsiella arboris]MXV52514.1 GNAT family N-acetyltransferase [Hufsiella arboris]
MRSHQLHVEKVSNQQDLEKVFEIRRIVFVGEQNCPPELEWEHEDESTHFLAFVNDVPAGAARWRKTEQGFKLERFAVLKDFRGLGVGAALVENVLADVKPSKDDYVYLNAQITAMGLYAKFDFEKVGEQFEEAGIQHFKMVLKK